MEEVMSPSLTCTKGFAQLVHLFTGTENSSLFIYLLYLYPLGMVDSLKRKIFLCYRSEKLRP